MKAYTGQPENDYGYDADELPDGILSVHYESEDFQSAIDAAVAEGRPDLARRITDAAAGAFYASLAC